MSQGLRGLSGGNGSPFYARLLCAQCERKLQRRYPRGASHAYWSCGMCGKRIDDDDLRKRFCDAFNAFVAQRDLLLPGWKHLEEAGTPLQKVRARQMAAITAEGAIPYEVPELTQAVLQQAWLREDGRVAFVFLSGETIPPG